MYGGQLSASILFSEQSSSMAKVVDYNRNSCPVFTMGYRVVCQRHNLKQFCSTMGEAKSVQVQHQRDGCLEAEVRKPGQR